jgi:hypothetical protein
MCGHRRALRADRLLSLVTFFAAAKKVTAAPHRGNASKPKAHEQTGKRIRPMVFKPPQTTANHLAKKTMPAPHRGKQT